MEQKGIMPLADFKAICDAVREKVGTTDTYKSGDLADVIANMQTGGGSMDILNLLKGKVGMTDATFVSCGFPDINTSSVADMSYLFSGCASLTSIDLTGWNLQSVTNILNIFYGCTALTSIIGSHTQYDVDNGLHALANLSQPIDVSMTAMSNASICAIINGLATITTGYMINMSHSQYATLKAYTSVDYIALAKSKGWLVGDGGYSDETIDCEQAGTIIGKDADGNIKYVKYSDFVADDFDTSTFTPVAVLVIPKSHTSDGKCRGVSLMQMSRTTPEAGTTSNETMNWGVYGTEEILTNYSSATTGNVSLGGTLGVSGNVYLPTDKIVGTASVVDAEGGIAKSQYGNSAPYMPSPYGAEGIVNVQYRDGASNNKVQCNTDMSGAANTQVIIDVLAASTSSGVLIDGSGAISNTQANYPAFATCYRYQGGGYSDHSWYLPSCGEMGYFVVRWGAINDALTAIRSKYGTTAACLVNSGSYHWSSTEYSSNYARFLMPSSGYVYTNNKSNSYAVRAFHAF